MVSVVSCSHPCQVLWFFSRGGGTAMKTKKTKKIKKIQTIQKNRFQLLLRSSW